MFVRGQSGFPQGSLVKHVTALSSGTDSNDRALVTPDKHRVELPHVHGQNWSRISIVLPSQQSRPTSLNFFTAGRRGVLANAYARTSDGHAQIHALWRVLKSTVHLLQPWTQHHPLCIYGRRRWTVDLSTHHRTQRRPAHSGKSESKSDQNSCFKRIFKIGSFSLRGSIGLIITYDNPFPLKRHT